MKREYRNLAQAELRAKSGGKGIEGYAAVFNQPSEDLGGFTEKIMPGAFSDCLSKDPDVRALFNHDPSLVLGRTTAKTLRLDEDDKGLHFDCDLPDTQPARDLMTSIGRGDISQCSFGFTVNKQKFSEEKQDDGEVALIRELHAVDLFDVSPVTFPAYPQTSVDKRSLWPDGMPRSLRLVTSVLAHWRQDDDDENENGCACDCSNCDDDDCENCSNVACDDADCCDNGRTDAGPQRIGDRQLDAAQRQRQESEARDIAEDDGSGRTRAGESVGELQRCRPADLQYDRCGKASSAHLAHPARCAAVCSPSSARIILSVSNVRPVEVTD